jgi:hypothetical protein
MHDNLAHQIDVEYEMIHFMGTMKTPYITIMDGITSKLPETEKGWHHVY